MTKVRIMLEVGVRVGVLVPPVPRELHQVTFGAHEAEFPGLQADVASAGGVPPGILKCIFLYRYSTQTKTFEWSPLNTTIVKIHVFFLFYFRSPVFSRNVNGAEAL